jgi:hypothetical protein
MKDSGSKNILFRFCVYCTVLVGLVGLSSYLIQILGGDLVMRENGIVEWGQVLCLVFTTILLYYASKYSPEYQELFHVLYILPMIAIIRENDYLLDTYLFDESWETFVIIGLIYLGYVLTRIFHPVVKQFIKFTHTQPFICFVLGCFIIFVFSRIVGQQSLWRALLQERHHRAIGGFIEEIMEFLGYCIVLIGAIESYLEAKQSCQIDNV